MRKLLIAALLLSTSGANAGWFGPSDYRECVLDEMKGRAASMLPTVKGLCNERFPCPTSACNGDYCVLAACPGGNLD
jgi:hypothetical protein